MALPSVASGFSVKSLANAVLTGKNAQDLFTSINRNFPPPDQKDSFWRQWRIDPTRWDQRWPYQLLVVEPAKGGGGYVIVNDWSFVLPIPPQGLNISMPFASVASATLNGIVEENAGAPFRIVRLSGTTGVMPTRPSAEQKDTPGGGFAGRLAANILAGTITALGRLSSSVKSLLGNNDSLNLLTVPQLETHQPLSGYVQFHLLRRFLEEYATMRRTSAGRNRNLALSIYKDNNTMIVTPTEFTMNRDVSSPLEYRYSLTLRAWQRVSLVGSNLLSPAKVLISTAATPGGLTQILNKIDQARRVLAEIKGLGRGLVGDADRLGEILRQGSLLVRDAIGTFISLVDVPAQIMRDARGTIASIMLAVNDINEFGNRFQSSKDRFSREAAAFKRDFEPIKDALVSAKDATTGAYDRIVGDPVSRKLNDLRGKGKKTPPLPLTDIFDDPVSNYSALSLIDLAALDLSPSTLNKIEDEKEKQRRRGRRSINDDREEMVRIISRMADASGAGDPNFANTFNQPDPQPQKTISRTVLKAMHALNEASVAYAQLALTRGDAAEDAALRGLEQVAGHADRSNIPFRVPRSKYPVPLPYGTTIERFAALYLGDADRAPEIIALNGLRAPYIDEAGWTKIVRVPGSGNTVVVADDEFLFSGQTVWVGSNLVPRTKRHIVSIHRISDDEVHVVLDGDADLDRYSPISNAILQGFRPGTVNSQSLIFIPSDDEPDGSFRISGIADFRNFDAAASAGGVDLLLTPANDLVVTPDGDGRWSSGLTNLAQQFRLLISLQRGGDLRHPERGLGLRPGESTADLPAEEVVAAVREALAGDPAFRSINQVSLSKVGPKVRLSVTTDLNNGELAIPLSVDLK